MPKLQIKANELVGTDASFVSLVKRGANRIPFRITKEEEPMLDLHKIGRGLFKKADPKPEIVAAIIQPGADVSRAAAFFKSAGLEPKQFVKSEQDGITTVAKADYADAQDVALLKMGDDMVVAVSNLKKSFDSYAYNSTDFNVIMATEGVYPSMCVAKDALGATISNILYKASSPAEAADQVATAIDDFKTYMVGLLGAVPMTAFKMDIAIAQDLAKAAGQKLPDDKSGAGAEEPAPKPKAKKDDVPAASDEQPVAEAAAEAEPAKVEKDAGKNGTGAAFEAGKGTGTDPKATADDAANTAVNATAGESTTGNDSEGPAEVKKEQIAGAPDPKGHEPGDADGFAAAPADSDAATARASADDKKMKQNGGTDGSSIPDGNSGLDRLGGIRKEGDAEAAEEPEAKGDEPEAQAEEPAPVAKSDNSDILAAIADLKKSLEGSVDEVRSTVSALSERVDGVAEQARKADEAINGTVFNEAGGDAVTRTQKADDDGAPPLLDTAYSRRAVA